MTTRRTLPTLSLLGAIAIMALASSASGQSRDARAVRELSDQWQRDVAAGNLDKIIALHAADAVVIMANNPIANGSDAIRGMWANFLRTPGLNLHWTPTKIEVASPTVATEYGTYAMSYDTPTGKVSDAGNYVTIWHKINGQWRVALDAPVTSTPMPNPAASDSTRMAMRDAGTLAWSDLSVPGFAPGAKIAVVHGNPGGAGGVVLRLQFPDGYQIPVHWHPNPENVTVLSGNLQLAGGNAFDASALHTFGPGDYAYMPARQPHFGQTRGVTIVQVQGRGPFQINLGVPK